jgi:hypothetical protein
MSPIPEYVIFLVLAFLTKAWAGEMKRSSGYDVGQMKD